MVVEPREGSRKRRLHVYLREDIVEALERVSADFDLTVSRVVEILLAFNLELNSVAEKGRFMAEVNKRFHKTT